MRNGTTSLRKVAMVRDERYPVGVAAPLYLRCHCGGRPRVPDASEAELVACKGCGTTYTRTGWMVEAAPAFAGLDAYENSVAPVDHD